MRKSTRSWKERICALLLAAVMVVTWMMPNAALTAEAAPEPGETTTDVIFSIIDADNNDALLKSGITIKIFDSSNTQVKIVNNAEDDGTYRIPSLPIEKEYTYTIEKTGYKYSSANDEKKERTFTPTTEERTVSVSMDMSDISISKTGNIEKVGDTCQLSVL